MMTLFKLILDYTMIFTYLSIDNIYSFYKAELDLTYKRKPKNSTIAFEYLEQCPKFYVKRVCILSGANATGKTSFGRLLQKLQWGVLRPFSLLTELEECRYHKDKPAHIIVEFVTTLNKPMLHKMTFLLQDKKLFAYASTPIYPSDTVNKARQRLDKIISEKRKTKNSLFTTEEGQAVEWLSRFISTGWYYLLSENEVKHKLNEFHNDFRLDVLKSVLTTFDKAIVDVQTTRDLTGQTGFSIRFDNGDICLLNLDGKLTQSNRLSRGTYDAISIAHLISWLMIGSQGMIYYIDEKLASSHSELEIAILNLIIDKLSNNGQFFYTTHNYDIFDMNLPIHTYLFLVKDNDGSGFIWADELKSTKGRRLIECIKNDVFRTLPSTSSIDNILWENN